VCYTVTKSGGLRSVKALKFKKWGLQPSSLIEVYAYVYTKDLLTDKWRKITYWLMQVHLERGYQHVLYVFVVNVCISV